MTSNNFRFDLSEYLIHFFRKLDPSADDCPLLPEHWGFNQIQDCMDEPLSPLFLLRNSIRYGRIWATWSVRSARRTIYGTDPAVCFTEMPIAAFLEAGEQRKSKGEKMSSYGLVIPKTGLHHVGGRPVIYGLDGDVQVKNGPYGERRIETHLLPAKEQYRYVTYVPGQIDWSHEREWRWPLRNAPPMDPEEVLPDIADLHGLDLDDPELSGLGVIVSTHEQAEKVLYGILAKVDRNEISADHYRFILPIEDIPDISVIRDRGELNQALSAAAIDLSPYFATTDKQAAALEDTFSKLVKSVEKATPKIDNGEIGGCWLWILDHTHPLSRALIKTGRAQMNQDGKCLASLPEYNDHRSMAQRETMTQQLAKSVKKAFGVETDYFSVLKEDNIDGVPFYCGDQIDNKKLFNWSNDADDF